MNNEWLVLLFIDGLNKHLAYLSLMILKHIYIRAVVRTIPQRDLINIIWPGKHVKTYTVAHTRISITSHERWYCLFVHDLHTRSWFTTASGSTVNDQNVYCPLQVIRTFGGNRPRLRLTSSSGVRVRFVLKLTIIRLYLWSELTSVSYSTAVHCYGNSSVLWRMNLDPFRAQDQWHGEGLFDRQLFWRFLGVGGSITII